MAGAFGGPNPFASKAGGTGGGGVGASPQRTQGAFSGANPFSSGLNPDGSVQGSVSEEQLRMDGSGYGAVAPLLQKAQTTAAGRFLTGALTLGGKILQPLAAPQQLIFGAFKSIGDLASSDPTQAYEDLKRGSQAALSYLTYGGYQAAKGKDSRDSSILGYDILKDAGANPWLAKWGGLAMDFFVDVPLVGKAAKFAKLDKLGGIGAKFDNVFQNGTDLQKFALHIAAAPMSNAPIPHLVAALPAGNIGNLAGREQMARNIAELIEKGRFSQGNQNLTKEVSSSFAENVISPTGRVRGLPAVDLNGLATTGARSGTGLPDAYIALENRARQVKANVSACLMAAGHDVVQLTKDLSYQQKQQYQEIMGHLVDHQGPADQMKWRGALQSFASQTADPAGFLTKADKALRHSTQADVFAAENLHAVGLMTPGSLQAYQSGDKGHLRRMFSMWENPGQHLERIRNNLTTESLTVNPQKLSGFFDNAANLTGKRANPGLGAQMAADFQAAYRTGTPDGPLVDVLKKHNFSEAETLTVLKDLAGEFSAKAGLKYVPDNMELYDALRTYSDNSKQGFGGAGGIVGGSSTKPIAQRTQLADYQLEALGEINDHMKRVERQGQVVGKIVSRRMVTQGYYDLMQKDGVVLDKLPHSMTDTSGWRTVSAEQAQAFGIPQLEGKMIPALFHRRLVDTVTIKDPSVQSAIWDWTAAAWRRSKLANPASIARNMASGYIAAQQFGIGQRELLQGGLDYARLVSGAKRGDGIFDTAHKVNGVSMAELADHGEFIHASMMHNEVTGPMAAMTDKIANEAGSPFQQHVAKMVSWLDAVKSGQQGKVAQGALTGAGLAGDLVGLGTGPITKFLSDNYGMVDAHMKGSIYMAMRRKGMTPLDAAHHADEALFNYENVPYIVNGLRKLGLAGLPFASYQVLATGRFFKNMYERPYLTARNYRLANSASADQTQEDKANEYYASPDYIKNSLWLRVGMQPDSKGVLAPQYFNFASLLPESPVWDMANSDNVTNFEPPSVQLYRTLLTGQGYQGRPTYNGGGSFSDTKAANPEEAARGALKAIWQFGASPWGPGQPMTERIVKAVAAQSVPVEQLDKPIAQALLKFYAQGPVAMLAKPGPEAVQRQGSAAPQNTVDALLREVGVALQTVEPNYSKAGTGQSNLMQDKAQQKLLQTQMRSEMRDATTAEQRREIAQRYKALMLQAVESARRQTGASRAAKKP